MDVFQVIIIIFNGLDSYYKYSRCTVSTCNNHCFDAFISLSLFNYLLSVCQVPASISCQLFKQKFRGQVELLFCNNF